MAYGVPFVGSFYAVILSAVKNPDDAPATTADGRLSVTDATVGKVPVARAAKVVRILRMRSG